MNDKFNTIIFEVDDRGLATITLNRPDKHHAFNSEMIGEIHQIADRVTSDLGIRAVLITSTGSSFCAGADLGWMKEQYNLNREGKIAEAKHLAMMLKALYYLPQPVICRVQGNAYGGGIGLMAVSDIVISVESAGFALTETRLGLIPATIGPFVIAKIGGAVARSVFITGSMMTADRAKDLGLVSICSNSENIDEVVASEINTAMKAAPAAMRRAKKMLRQITDYDLDTQIDLAIEHLADCWESDETNQGITAFFNKEKAPWASD